MNKKTTPSFSLDKSDIPGTLIIRFKSGPPYEDLAFRILNHEWELSEKKGFKCVYDRGILRVQFFFKKRR